MDNLPPEKKLIIAILSSVIEDYINAELFEKKLYHDKWNNSTKSTKLKEIENHIHSKTCELYANILSIDIEAYKKCFYKIKNNLNNPEKKQEIKKKYKKQHLTFFKNIVANLIKQEN